MSKIQNMGNPSEVLKSYGKSFYWAGKFLPIKNFNKASELYMFCRKLDDIADKQQNKNKLIILKWKQSQYRLLL